jgi:hypothetical protein
MGTKKRRPGPPDPWIDRIEWRTPLDQPVLEGFAYRGMLSGIEFRLEFRTEEAARGRQRLLALALAAGGGKAQYLSETGGIREAHHAGRDVVRAAVAQVFACAPVSDY